VPLVTRLGKHQNPQSVVKCASDEQEIVGRVLLLFFRDRSFAVVVV
jgi:hypothetical protein